VPFKVIVEATSCLRFRTVHETQMASTVTRSQWNIHGCAANKSAANMWCYHVNMDQNLWRMVKAPC